MKFSDLYVCCDNLKPFSKVTIVEGAQSSTQVIGKVYESICVREVEWFRIDYNNRVVVKLLYPVREGDEKK